MAPDPETPIPLDEDWRDADWIKTRSQDVTVTGEPVTPNLDEDTEAGE